MGLFLEAAIVPNRTEAKLRAVSLTAWPEDVLDAGETPKAYETGRFPQGKCWQMAGFMAKLDCPYDWE